MNKTLLFISALTLSGSLIAQTQIDNGGFENWENEGTANVEPTDWNSFKTADGNFSWAAPADAVIEQITDVHSGTYAVRIETVSGPFGVIVNGNLTVGRVQMGSTTPTAQSNHNHTVVADADFHHVMTDMPDSIVAWVKYTPVGNDSALISSQVHDDYDFEFPENAASADHGIVYAQKKFGAINDWTRISIPFDFTGLSTDPSAFILINLTSSAIPGGGEVGSEFFVDDLELIYNPAGIDELGNLPYSVHNTPEGVIVNMKSKDQGVLEVRNMAGQLIQTETLNNELTLVNVNENSGIYLFSIMSDKGQVTRKLFIK